ncbi:MAG: LemA family protein [Spirochaetales bacterium]|nr:LemA family protein [Spirochaetales bacterium]
MICFYAAAASVLLNLVIVALYNSLLQKANLVEKAYTQFNIQMRTHYHLMLSLAATICKTDADNRDYLGHITGLYSEASYGSLSDESHVSLENVITSTMKSIMTYAQNCPELLGNGNFINLQRMILEKESQISAFRQTYNESARDYNMSLHKIPINIFAAAFGFAEKRFLSTP